MSSPSLRRAPWIASVTLVSVLHTSMAAWAQAPAGSTTPSSTPPSAGSTPTTAAPSSAGASSESSVAAAREQARVAYGAGQEAYAAGQYAAAAEHFARADQLLPAIQAKYWRAMSLDKQGDVAGAYAALSVLLADAKKDELGAEKLQAVTARQRELGALPADLLVTTTPAGAHVQVSGVDVPTPTPLSLRLAPGRHELLISLPGYESQRVPITATPGAQLRPNVTLLPQTASAQTGPIAPLGETGALDTSSAPRSLVPGYVTLGIAGAAAIVGTIFGVRALGDKKDYDKNPTAKGADDVERNALIADMAFGVTLTLGVTGIVLLLADDSRQTASSPSSNSAGLHLLPYVSPKGAGAAASLSF
jgi:hypothetical protein